MSRRIRNPFHSPNSRRDASRKRSSVPYESELLEDRTLFTTVWLDFGFALPGGQLTVSDAEMRDPALNGPRKFGASQTLISLTRTLQNQNIDFNTDGAVNQIDGLLMADQVLSNVRRIFEPLNVQVFMNSARDLNDVRDRLSGATNDAYIFVFGDDPAANPAFGWGQVDRDDARDDRGLNRFDNVAFAFADEIIRMQGAANAVTALSLVAAHEAAHTFGAEHTRADQSIAAGVVMGAPIDGNDTRRFDVVNHISRFPMPTEESPFVLEDTYLTLAAAVGTGTNPIRTYVSGTGLNDRITISRNGQFSVNVKVDAFQDSAFKQFVRSHSYTISPGQDVIIEAGVGDDQIIIDGSIDARFRVRGGAGNDRVLLNVQGGPTDIITDRANARAASVSYNEFGETEQLILQGDSLSSVNVLTANIPLTIRNAGAVTLGNGQLTGIGVNVVLAGTSAQTDLRLNAVNDAIGSRYDIRANRVDFGLRNVQFGPNTLESLRIDAGIGADSIIVTSTPALPFNRRLQNDAKITFNTGAGRDQVLVQSTGVPLRVNDGGGGDEVWVGRLTSFVDPNIFSLNNQFVVDQILQTVHVTSTDGSTTLNVVDTGNVNSRNIALDVAGGIGRVTGLTPNYVTQGGLFGFDIVSTAISFDNMRLRNLNIYGGSGLNTYDVYNTMINGQAGGRLGRDIANTSLFTGSSSDTVNVHGTTGMLTVNTQGGLNTVTIGTPDSAINRFGLDKVLGDVSVRGGADGLTYLAITDRDGGASRSFALYDAGLDIGNGTVVLVENIYDLAILGGAFGNSFTIEGTPQIGDLFPSIDLFTGSGSDNVWVKRTNEVLTIDLEEGLQATVDIGAENLDEIQSPIHIIGAPAGIRMLRLNDVGNANVREAELHPEGVSWNAAQHVFYDAGWTPAISWNGGSGDDLITLSGGRLGGVVNAGAGDDYIFISGRDGLLSNLGVFRIDDSQGIDSVFIYDTLETADQTYTLDRAIFLNLSTTGTTINFSNGLELIALSAGAGNNTYDLRVLPENVYFELTGGAGNETLLGPNLNADWYLTGPDGRHVVMDGESNFAIFSQIENLQAGSGDDRFLFDPNALAVAGNIDGGDGNNTLDYSVFTEGVYVNLPQRAASLVDGLVSSITTVIGGSGNDVLVGNGGNVLQGGEGRDLLIAGGFASQLYAGSGEDLLLAGTTDYDDDTDSLFAIRDFWSREDLSYQERFAGLLAGDGVPTLDGVTVQSNGGENLLFGSDDPEELDLYFAVLGSDLLDADVNDELILL